MKTENRVNFAVSSFFTAWLAKDLICPVINLLHHNKVFTFVISFIDK